MLHLVLAGALIATSQQAPVSDSLRADSAFRRSDWPTVERLYSAIARQQPTQGMAWLRLGMARQALNKPDAAIPAFEKALELRFQVPTATYRLARLDAARGNADRAFTYLDQLVPLRAIPVAILDTVSELASVRGDTRYAAIRERMVALRYPCRTSPQTRQFDFWIGDWVVTPFQQPPGPNMQVLGHNRIELQLEHCMIVENWTGGGPGGGEGKSINFWDTNRSKWRQVWVADGGSSLDYEGELRDGAMRFEGWTLAPNGARVLQKLTFFPIHLDTVRQLFETSTDSGRTWIAGFDGRYIRRK
ncbi:MAG: tetratricopeptide repeat protein [Gemmatimonadaceae bacterium]